MKKYILKKNYKKTWLSFKEYIHLFWLNTKVQFGNFIQFLKVLCCYYPNWQFAKIDFSLLMSYLLNNPYILSKKFLQDRAEKEIYLYGETPLTTMDLIAKECKIKKDDHVFDLGCGRGRNCFWLHYFIGCKVTGIDQISQFIEKANLIKKRFSLENIYFQNEDIRETNLDKASVIYLYGTSLEDQTIFSLIKKFENLPSGTKIISVSYPLSDYADTENFEIMKRFSAPFTWGETDIYLQIRK